MDDGHPDDSPTGSRPETPAPHPAPPTAEPDGAGVRRQVVEFLVLLVAGIILIRYFVAEAYVVPTGSMAPTILGFHWELDCPNCHARFSVGLDEGGRLAGRPVCPNCGQDGIDPSTGVEASGDRLLVQKFLFDLRPPRRWEVAVFQSPIEPSQAYVKRVVGLPGETVQIVDGDVRIDGAVARKSLDEIRATRIPVFDNQFRPRDAERFPRWAFRADRSRRFRSTGWASAGTGFVHEATSATDEGEDWLEYRHWDPDRAQYGPIRDSYPYNGGDQRGGHPVRALVFEARLSPRDDVAGVDLRIAHGADLFRVHLPVDGRGPVAVTRNGRVQGVTNIRGGLRSSPAAGPTWATVELALVDRRLSLAIDGKLLFDPIDFESPASAPLGTPSPVALGLVNGSLAVEDLRIYRDIYYTGELFAGVRRPFAVEEPFTLREGEFFVLGDNSPVSNDSRFWNDRPVVRRGQFLGKPFLVHLPGQAYGVRIFGHELGWIPDFREIRYIR